ncbi:BA75_03277T0 [Komagataella pastoris]|uniref:BA75_03277T0 n=1 Tax=Komagataella pastoris TaxID=4922 RepID=A0A1B2JC05_PICPA|nr:BA75_03277T0 [Komagataella pastoris]
MKLAEALIIRKDIYKNLKQLENRIRRNITIQEGTSAPENSTALLKEYNEQHKEYVGLVVKINLTNAKVSLNFYHPIEEKEVEATMTEALALRDYLKERSSALREFAAEASSSRTVLTRTEVRFKTTMKASDIQKEQDRTSKLLRQLDLKIQEKNWNVELE